METNLLDRMLTAYMTSRTPITITLQNKIRVAGRIKAFDSYVIVMEGQKREIVYRHAVSCLAEWAEEPKRSFAPSKAATVKTLNRPAKAADQKPRASHPHAALSATPDETSLNNSMKEGLIKWMQEQKAAK